MGDCNNRSCRTGLEEGDKKTTRGKTQGRRQQQEVERQFYKLKQETFDLKTKIMTVGGLLAEHLVKRIS